MSADPASKRKSRASLLDLFVSEAEIRKLRGELQLRKDVSVFAVALPRSHREVFVPTVSSAKAFFV